MTLLFIQNLRRIFSVVKKKFIRVLVLKIHDSENIFKTLALPRELFTCRKPLQTLWRPNII